MQVSRVCGEEDSSCTRMRQESPIRASMRIRKVLSFAFESIGLSGPNPFASRRAARIPALTRYARTAFARAAEEVAENLKRAGDESKDGLKGDDQPPSPPKKSNLPNVKKTHVREKDGIFEIVEDEETQS